MCRTNGALSIFGEAQLEIVHVQVASSVNGVLCAPPAHLFTDVVLSEIIRLESFLSPVGIGKSFTTESC